MLSVSLLSNVLLSIVMLSINAYTFDYIRHYAMQSVTFFNVMLSPGILSVVMLGILSASTFQQNRFIIEENLL